MQATKPDKQQVRDWMAARTKSSAPPESPERIKELLGWRMLEAQRDTKLQQR